MNTILLARKTVARELSVDVEDCSNDATLRETLGADSLDLVSMAMELERVFDIDFPDEDLERMKTVGDVIHWVTQKVDGADTALRRRSASEGK